jgi:lipopolysaccharide transport system ATP-binding protein
VTPECVIKADELSKVYRLGSMRGGGYRASGQTRVGMETLGETLASRFARVVRRGSAEAKPRGPATLWALRDVSFEINQGDTVGFVGPNGAGKSTLLKILSRITRPTSGRARLHGRVGSLLEVGTGFHAELTGRENIYMNGALLGLSRGEIKKRYDAIVAFAEVEDFLDTPIKRYSSGMVVRLAFAVAAHLEPDILLVDEVLAVGDLAFQRKCLAKMGESASEGRTVVFVSHNMAIIQAFCKRGIFIEHGSIQEDGPIQSAVSAYLRAMEDQASTLDLSERVDRTGKQEVQVKGVTVAGPETSLQALRSGAEAKFTVELTGTKPGLSCTFQLYDQLGHPVTTLSTEHPAAEDVWEPQEHPFFECLIPELPLVPGRYRLDITLGGLELQDHIKGAAYFDVADGLYAGRAADARWFVGDVLVAARWRGPDTTLALA